MCIRDRGIVVPDYVTEPPDALPPAIVGALIDEKVDMQDIISTLIDLAHRGYLTMEEKEKRGYEYTLSLINISEPTRPY